MSAKLAKIIAGVAVCVSCANATAGLDPQCYSNIGVDEDTGWEHGDKKPIHIDVQRPSQGVMGQTATYDASASKTPSGSISFEWSEVTGGLKYSSYDQPNIQVVTSTSLSSLNAFTGLVVTDPVCGFSERTEFNVSYMSQ